MWEKELLEWDGVIVKKYKFFWYGYLWLLYIKFVLIINFLMEE